MADERFEVFRMEKLKTEGDVFRTVRHTVDLSYINEQGEEVFYRKTRDETREKENQYCYQHWKDKEGNLHTNTKEQCLQNAMKKFHKGLPEKVRKNAVVGASLIFTFSHEMLKDKKFNSDKYLVDCYTWACEKFGKDNIFNWGIHRDEKTPHLEIQFLPKDEKGNLNARKIFGNKKTLSEWQDKFHEEVGKKYGLERGIRKTNIIHETLNRFYGALKNLDEDLDKLELDKKSFSESWEEYQERTKQTLKAFVEPMLRPLASLRKEVAKLEKRVENFEAEKAHKEAELKKQKEALEASQKALDEAEKAFESKVSTEVEKRLQEKIPEVYKELGDMYVPKDLVFTKGDKTVNFHKQSYEQLAQQLSDFYLDDEPKVHERKREIEREFARNRVITH